MKKYSEFQLSFNSSFEEFYNELEKTLGNESISIEEKKAEVPLIWKKFNLKINNYFLELKKLEGERFFDLKVKELHRFFFNVKESLPSRNDLSNIEENSTDEEQAKLFGLVLGESDSSDEDLPSNVFQSFTYILAKNVGSDKTWLTGEHKDFLLEVTRYRKIIRDKVLIDFKKDSESIELVLNDIDNNAYNLDSQVFFPLPLFYLYKIYYFFKNYGVFYVNKIKILIKLNK